MSSRLPASSSPRCLLHAFGTPDASPACSVTTLEQMKAHLPVIRSELQIGKGDGFKGFYNFVFRYVKDPTQKSMGVWPLRSCVLYPATSHFPGQGIFLVDNFFSFFK